jgi:hypothetical protein
VASTRCWGDDAHASCRWGGGVGCGVGFGVVVGRRGALRCWGDDAQASCRRGGGDFGVVGEGHGEGLMGRGVAVTGNSEQPVNGNSVRPRHVSHVLAAVRFIEVGWMQCRAGALTPPLTPPLCFFSSPTHICTLLLSITCCTPTLSSRRPFLVTPLLPNPLTPSPLNTPPPQTPPGGAARGQWVVPGACLPACGGVIRPCG